MKVIGNRKLKYLKMSAVVLFVQNYSFLPSFVASQVVPGVHRSPLVNVFHHPHTYNSLSETNKGFLNLFPYTSTQKPKQNNQNWLRLPMPESDCP
jgi:hypothetical protein